MTCEWNDSTQTAEKRSCTQNNFSYAIVAWWPRLTITNDHGYVPFVVITIRFFPHSWRTTGFLTRVTRRVSRGQKELPTLSYSVFRDVRVVQSFVLWIVFYRSLFVLLSFYMIIVLSDLLLCTASHFPFSVFKPFTFLTYSSNFDFSI